MIEIRRLTAPHSGGRNSPPIARLISTEQRHHTGPLPAGRGEGDLLPTSESRAGLVVGVGVEVGVVVEVGDEDGDEGEDRDEDGDEGEDGGEGEGEDEGEDEERANP
jgi:hypothetical protein